MKTGKLIEAIMQYNHIGISELADKTDMELSNVIALITGRRNITTRLASKIGKVLDIDASVIMANRISEELETLDKANEL